MKIFKYIINLIIIILVIIYIIKIDYNNIKLETITVNIPDKKLKSHKLVQEKKELNSNVSLDMYIGAMSGYGPDCIGCSGYLAYGLYVGNGNIIYNDQQYGQLRILAADSSIPFGTIVKVKNSNIKEFKGIVLDRGGAIGFGKRFLFDLLYHSEEEASIYAVSYNTTFEILRYGF